MELIEDIAGMKAASGRVRRSGQTLGFVPTMGFFHEGHLSLMRRSAAHCDYTAVSLFVNPAQFAPTEDLDRYPRDFERDRDLAEKEGVNFLFCPDGEAMYPEGFETSVTLPGLSDRMCGLSRPTHFQGVATVVLKLFNIVRPDVAFFGQKDAQQAVIIRRMARDLDLDVRIEVLPIVREPDGLAMSSRNAYLSAAERTSALSLIRSLRAAEEAVTRGERDAKRVAGRVMDILAKEKGVALEYLVICDAETLEKMDRLHGKVLIAVAASVGATRLIDNIIINVENKVQ
jgi:pantoate--beta-alanine ligase